MMRAAVLPPDPAVVFQLQNDLYEIGSKIVIRDFHTPLPGFGHTVHHQVSYGVGMRYLRRLSSPIELGW